MNDKVKELPVKFKTPPTGEMFLVRGFGNCRHGQYIVDPEKLEVECGRCHEKLNPMAVLTELATRETLWHQSRASYQDEMKRLQERSRTKCQHCDKMTRISRS